MNLRLRPSRLDERRTVYLGLCCSDTTALHLGAPDYPESPVPNPPSAESHLNGFNTDQMLKQLGNLNPQQFMSGDKNPQGGDAGKEGGNGG